jgi:hypothetical protein
MPRIIRLFDKKNECYLGEIKLPDIPLKELQEIFDIDVNNPMYDSYYIGKEKEFFFKKYVQIEFDFDKSDYFLE